jgi:hypothetical protein
LASNTESYKVEGVVHCGVPRTRGKIGKEMILEKKEDAMFTPAVDK